MTRPTGFEPVHWCLKHRMFKALGWVFGAPGVYSTLPVKLGALILLI